MAANAQPADKFSSTCNIATSCAERFSKRAHKDIDGTRWNIEVIADTASMRSNCPDRVRFIDKEEELNKQKFSEVVRYLEVDVPCISSSVP